MKRWRSNPAKPSPVNARMLQYTWNVHCNIKPAVDLAVITLTHRLLYPHFSQHHCSQTAVSQITFRWCALISAVSTCLRHLGHCYFWATDLVHLLPWQEPHHLSFCVSSSPLTANYDALSWQSWQGCRRIQSMGKWAHASTHLRCCLLTHSLPWSNPFH